MVSTRLASVRECSMRWRMQRAECCVGLLHATLTDPALTVPLCSASVSAQSRPACARLAMSFFGSSGSRKSNYNKADEAGVSREERMNRLKFELREHIRFLAGQISGSMRDCSRRRQRIRARSVAHCACVSFHRD